MPNLPERKESPIMGSAGVGGGVGSNLVSAKGGVYDASNYVDGLFSAYAFRGNSTAGHQIKTDIDMTQEGLVWIKKYTGTDNHLFQDTFSTSSFGSTTENNGASAWQTGSNNAITAFNDNGFTLGGGAWGSNASGEDIVAFTFRKRAKFFDLVEFTEGSSNQTISHSLGCAPKMIVFACKTNGSNWWTWMDGATSTTQYLKLNSNDQVTGLGFDGWGTINSNSFEFKPSVWGVGAGAKWVAYLWAGDENSFGPNENQPICKVGTYTGTGGDNYINLGWKPQWIMFKRMNGGSNWYILDTRRGLNAWPLADQWMGAANTGGDSGYPFGFPTSEGVCWKQNNSDFNGSGNTYCYIAIRDMDGYVAKPPDKGSDCFNLTYGGGGNTPSSPPFQNTGSTGNSPNGWNTEICIDTVPGSSSYRHWTSPMYASRVEGQYWTSNTTDGWQGWSGYDCDTNVGSIPTSNRGSDSIAWQWKRGAGCQCVFYEGTGSSQNVKHNLNAVPEFIEIHKTSSEAWECYHFGGNNGSNPWTGYLKGNERGPWVSDGGSRWGGQPTTTTFTVGNDSGTNQNGSTYMAWLYASVPGISKCGYYTGTGASNPINLGFRPRWVLIKNTSTGSTDWLIWDTLRGWDGTTDNAIKLNTGDAQTAQSLGPPTATGFTLDASTIQNINGNHYSYYAIS